jgi:hypothetical protein
VAAESGGFTRREPPVGDLPESMIERQPFVAYATKGCETLIRE